MGWRFKFLGTDGINNRVDDVIANALTVRDVDVVTCTTVQITGLTMPLLMSWWLEMSTSSGVQTSNKLCRSIYGLRHVSFFDWPLSRIEMLLRLSCIFPIKTNLLFSFLHFPVETHCQSATVIVVRTTRQYCLIDRQHTCLVHLLFPLLI